MVLSDTGGQDRAGASGGYDNPSSTDDGGRPVQSPLPRSPASAPVVMQPRLLEGGREPIPVSTVNWRSTDRSQFIPMHGLDFLIGVNTLVVQQTVELGDLMTTIESENRYVVKVPGGEALYLGMEMSSATQRLLCGAGRAFSLVLLDGTRQMALELRRRLGAASCWFPCCLQEMQVTSPPGEYLGRVQQQWTFMVPFFLVRDGADDVRFLLEGPRVSGCNVPAEVEFKVLSADGLTQQGSVVHRWDRETVNYTITVNFPIMATEPKHKALLLAAAFLLEYTYFERAKSTRCLRCNCL